MTHLSFCGGGNGGPRDYERRYGDGTKMQGSRSAEKQRREEAGAGEMTPCCANALLIPHGRARNQGTPGRYIPHDL